MNAKRRMPIRRELSVLALAAAVVLTVALAPSAAQAQAKTKLKLYRLDCGEAEVLKPERWAPDAPQEVPPRMFVPCYVIVHPRGTLIWGVGLSQALLEKPEGVVIPNGALRILVKRSLPDQLKSIGLEPKDFTFVSMSHLHPDHASNANLFAGATWIVQQEEYDAVFGPDPQKYGFNPDLVSKLKDGEVMKLSGDLDLFSDGSVVVLRSPGHTPGHQSLFVDLPKTGPLLLSGDLWHFAGNRAAKRVPSFNFSPEQTRASMEKIERFVATHKATVWIEHDWAQNAQLRGAPNLYD